MECNVIKDLLPLYIDGCCSKESARLVQEHIETCTSCRELYESMKTSLEVTPAASVPKKLKKINDWKASILQSILLFVSFAIITVGVSLEAASPAGLLNGFWALTLVIPATGFLLSLINWYFVRLYKSRKRFSDCSLLATLVITLGAYIWAGFHYEMHPFSCTGFSDFVEGLFEYYGLLFGGGMILTVFFCVLSKLLSNAYADMLGKE